MDAAKLVRPPADWNSVTIRDLYRPTLDRIPKQPRTARAMAHGRSKSLAVYHRRSTAEHDARTGHGTDHRAERAAWGACRRNGCTRGRRGMLHAYIGGRVRRFCNPYGIGARVFAAEMGRCRLPPLPGSMDVVGLVQSSAFPVSGRD